jgi:CheY-like chemotaxis protein
MARVQLIHWKESEGRARADDLRGLGHSVQYEADGSAALALLRAEPVDVIVIDCTRLPSHGRAAAHALRQRQGTRFVPLVFLGGEEEKLAQLRSEVPDAVFAAWDGACKALEHALAHPPRDPVVPASPSSDKPLVEKLGWKPATTLALIEAPEYFERVLGTPPAGATLRRGRRGKSELALWFVTTKKELSAALPAWKKLVEDGIKLWVAWPKKGSRVATDLAQDFVRTTPHAHDLVDYKICALDEDWSGMCFGK